MPIQAVSRRRVAAYAVVFGFLPSLILWLLRKRRQNKALQEAEEAARHRKLSSGQLLRRDTVDFNKKAAASKAVTPVLPNSCSQCSTSFSIWRFRRSCTVCSTSICSYCSTKSADTGAITCHRCERRKQQAITCVGQEAESTTDEGKPYGVLCVDVVEAIGIIAADQNILTGAMTSSDPYCVVTLNQWPEDRPDLLGPGVKTRCIQQTLHPRWKERFVFAVSASTPKLHIELWDEDRFTANDPMGVVNVELSDVLPQLRGAEVTSWFKIEAPPDYDGPCGGLLLHISWEEFDFQKHLRSFIYPVHMPPPPFDLDSIYAPAVKCADILSRAKQAEGAHVKRLADIFAWVSPVQSLTTIIIWIVFARWLQYWPCIACVFLAAKMSAAKLLTATPGLTLAAQQKTDEEEDNEKHLSQGIQLLARGLPHVVRDSLRPLQVCIPALAGALETVGEIIGWRHDSSSALLAVLFILALLFCFVTFGTLLAIVGALVLLLQAPWVSGGIRYASWRLAHRKTGFTPIAEPQEAWLSNDYLKQQSDMSSSASPTEREGLRKRLSKRLSSRSDNESSSHKDASNRGICDAWTTALSCHERVHLIDGKILRWQDGCITNIRITSGAKIEMIFQDQSYVGELRDDDKIYWNDNDVWHRYCEALTSDSGKMSDGLEKRFQDAAHLIAKGNALHKSGPADKLALYGLYKQASAGDNTARQPSAFQFEARAKWDHWNALKGRSKCQAMEEYVAEVDRQKEKFKIELPAEHQSETEDSVTAGSPSCHKIHSESLDEPQEEGVGSVDEQEMSEAMPEVQTGQIDGQQRSSRLESDDSTTTDGSTATPKEDSETGGSCNPAMHRRTRNGMVSGVEVGADTTQSSEAGD